MSDQRSVVGRLFPATPADPKPVRMPTGPLRAKATPRHRPLDEARGGPAPAPPARADLRQPSGRVELGVHTTPRRPRKAARSSAFRFASALDHGQLGEIGGHFHHPLAEERDIPHSQWGASRGRAERRLDPALSSRHCRRCVHPGRLAAEVEADLSDTVLDPAGSSSKSPGGFDKVGEAIPFQRGGAECDLDAISGTGYSSLIYSDVPVRQGQDRPSFTAT